MVCTLVKMLTIMEGSIKLVLTTRMAQLFKSYQCTDAESVTKSRMCRNYWKCFEAIQVHSLELASKVLRER